MSFLTKECLSRHPSPFQTTHVLQKLFSIPRHARNLSSSPFLRSVQKPKLQKGKLKQSISVSKVATKSRIPPPTKSSSVSTVPKTYRTYADQLAEKGHPTLLYEAPSNTLFKFFSYTGGFFCIAYSGYNIYVHYLHPPADLAKWVVYSFGGIAIFMSAFGTWLFLGPSKMIKSITALPKRMTVANVNSLTKTAPKSEVEVEIELSKMFPIPFFPARKLIVRPDEISLSHPLTQPLPPNLTVEERRLISEAEKRQLRELQDYEESHIMSRPFRHFGRGAKAAYNAAARTWLREGFVTAKIQGGNHKLDVSGGWALDGGRALDRLVVVKPRAPGSWLS